VKATPKPRVCASEPTANGATAQGFTYNIGRIASAVARMDVR
jgi:hypothetical protein